MSEDEGATWPVSRVVHEGPAAYSSLVVLPDRSIGLLFERGQWLAVPKKSPSCGSHSNGWRKEKIDDSEQACKGAPGDEVPGQSMMVSERSEPHASEGRGARVPASERARGLRGTKVPGRDRW